jgi:DNA-binding transcriptional ArsR family regulator
MGASKSIHFSTEQNELSLLFKALGHPARIAIIQHILETQSCVCGDLVEKFPLTQSTISQHLKELKAANIIQGTIEGNSICYCLNPDTLDKLSNVISVFIEAEKCKGTKCC